MAGESSVSGYKPFRTSNELGSTARTDGFVAYLGLDGYVHQRLVQTEQPKAEQVLPRVHLVSWVVKTLDAGNAPASHRQ
jgi:hypothetical protein